MPKGPWHHCWYCGEMTTEKSVCERCMRLYREYGINESHYQWLYERQGGACAICGEIHPAKGPGKLVVDHDHTRRGHAAIRGLLCQRCNQSLGVFGDAVEGIQKVLDYLRKPPPFDWWLD